MQCEICKKAAATVHLTDVSNGFKKEIHLCDGCASERGTTIKSHMNKSMGIGDIQPSQLAVEEPSDAEGGDGDLVCPSCGISFRKFRSTGKFGCPHDYQAFGRQVVQLLEKIHHKVQHVGKVPARASHHILIEKEIQNLREALRTAIDGEEYERAAEIRDQIYGLEGRLGAVRK